MKYLKGFIIAFARSSKVPRPRGEGEQENMKYVMCFFPWVGAVSGLCFYLWGSYGPAIPVGQILYGVILTVIPVLVTGGIHVDGFLDTMDALSSWQPRERRLEILKDSHAGAFAVIAGCLYFLTWFGFATELGKQGIPLVSLGFFLSRCLSGYGVTAFPCAKSSGLVSMFAEKAEKKKAQAALLAQTGAVLLLMLWINLYFGFAVLAVSGLVFFWYYRMSLKKFGGITGDLAGWFLQICELAILITVVAMEKIITVL